MTAARCSRLFPPLDETRESGVQTASHAHLSVGRHCRRLCGEQDGRLRCLRDCRGAVPHERSARALLHRARYATQHLESARTRVCVPAVQQVCSHRKWAHCRRCRHAARVLLLRSKKACRLMEACCVTWLELRHVSKAWVNGSLLLGTTRPSTNGTHPPAPRLTRRAPRCPCCWRRCSLAPFTCCSHPFG